MMHRVSSMWDDVARDIAAGLDELAVLERLAARATAGLRIASSAEHAEALVAAADAAVAEVRGRVH